MLEQFLKRQLEKEKSLSSATIAYLANLESTSKVSKKIAEFIVQELEDQRSNLKLIASENYSSLSTHLTLGNLLTDKYAEGYPQHRYYAGCDNIDAIESQACTVACELFEAEHAYIQPHSGADANLVAYWAILSKKIQKPWMQKIGVKNVSSLSREEWNALRKKLGEQKLLGLSYYSGGHLTHGYRQNVSARMFDAHTYEVDEDSGLLNYSKIEKKAREIKPLILLAGYSSYSRKIDFKVLREIADFVGAVLMVDMAHFAGLVAGKVMEGNFDPVKYAHVVTTTTHKTLRGPRGGMILCKKEFAPWVDQGCPLVLGGPLAHSMAAKAIALQEATTPEFRNYARQIVKNSQALANKLLELNVNVLSGGSENHIVIADIRKFNINGKQAESALTQCKLTVNRNSVPNDPNGPWYTSGVRLGTAALTSLGMKEKEMEEIAIVIHQIFSHTQPIMIEKENGEKKASKVKISIDESVVSHAREKVSTLCKKFVLYPELDLDLIREFISTL